MLLADPDLNDEIARSYTEKGNHSESINWYIKATRLDPDNPMPWLYLGYGYKDLKKKAEAIRAFKNYLIKKPDAEDKKMIDDEIYDLQQEQ